MQCSRLLYSYLLHISSLFQPNISVLMISYVCFLLSHVCLLQHSRIHWFWGKIKIIVFIFIIIIINRKWREPHSSPRLIWKHLKHNKAFKTIMISPHFKKRGSRIFFSPNLLPLISCFYPSHSLPFRHFLPVITWCKFSVKNLTWHSLSSWEGSLRKVTHTPTQMHSHIHMLFHIPFYFCFSYCLSLSLHLSLFHSYLYLSLTYSLSRTDTDQTRPSADCRSVCW